MICHCVATIRFFFSTLWVHNVGGICIIQVPGFKVGLNVGEWVDAMPILGPIATLGSIKIGKKLFLSEIYCYQ